MVEYCFIIDEETADRRLFYGLPVQAFRVGDTDDVTFVAKVTMSRMQMIVAEVYGDLGNTKYVVQVGPYLWRVGRLNESNGYVRSTRSGRLIRD